METSFSTLIVLQYYTVGSLVDCTACPRHDVYCLCVEAQRRAAVPPPVGATGTAATPLPTATSHRQEFGPLLHRGEKSISLHD